MRNHKGYDQHLDAFHEAVADLERRHKWPEDGEVARQWRDWLGNDLPWRSPRITDDEWFFITTLCGTMTLDGQRTHIRTFFPKFIELTTGNIRRVDEESVRPWKLRAPWMKSRLLRMAEILVERELTMTAYTDTLRELDRSASPHNPTPALDRIRLDHRAGGHKTLSLFIRDCVLGNCFPIDSRVAKVLRRYGLPAIEEILVRCALATHRNPREMARLFYNAGES